MIRGLQHTGWIQSIRPAAQAAPPPTPAAVEAPPPHDRPCPAALAPTPTASTSLPGRLLRAAVGVAQRISASLLPFGMFVPTFTTSTGPDLPKDFLKACGKRPERARALLQRLETLPADQREAAREHVRKMVSGSSASVDACVLEAITQVSAMPSPAARLAQVRELASLSTPAQALTDLKLADHAATTHGVSPETALSLVIALREADPGRKGEYRRFDDLRAPLDDLAAAREGAERDGRMTQIERFQGARRPPSKALPFVQAVDAFTCDEAEKAGVRDILRGVLKTYGSNDDANLLAALQAVDPRHPLEGIRVYARFLSETKRPTQALDDLRLAHTLASTGKATLQETAEHLVTLRQAEPSRKSDYRSFTPLRAVLEHVLSQPDSAAAREQLIRLQQKRATADEVLPLERGLTDLKVTDAQRAAIRQDLIHILGRCGRDERRLLAGVLPSLDGRADAHTRSATLRTLYDLDARRLNQAMADLNLAASAADRHQLSFDVAASRLVDLREQDKGRKADYPSFANLAAPLDALLASGGASRDDLARLAVNKRTPEQALPHLQRLQKMPGTDADRQAMRDDWRAVIKGYGPRADTSLLAALDVVEAPDATETRQRLSCFRDLLSLSGRPEQALADLRLAVAQAATSGRPFADAGKTVTLLREADPGRKADYPSFANLEAPAAYILGDKRAPEACVRDLRALQVKGRTPTDAFQHDQKLAAVTGSPSERAALRAAYVGLLKKTRRADDDLLRSLLADAAGTSSPAAVVEGAATLFDATGKVAVAVPDVEACLRRASASLPVDELLRHAVTLRENDASRKSDYPSWYGLDAGLDFIAGAPDASGRSARCDLLRRTMASRLTLGQALPHARRLDALKLAPDAKRAVTSAYLRVLGANRNGAPGVLDLFDGHDDAGQRAEAFARLVKVGRRGWDRATADLQTCSRYAAQSSVSFAEIARTVHAMRDGDKNGHANGGWAGLENGLPHILAGASETERRIRLHSYLRLLKNGQGNNATFSYLVTTPGDPLPQATTTLLRLDKRLKRSSDRASLRDLFTQVEKAAKDEPQSWLARWIHWPRTFERIAGRLLQKNSAPDTVKYLDALQRGRFDGERFKAAYARLQTLVGGAQKGERADLMAEAFATVNQPMASGTLDASQRWAAFTGILEEVRSPAAASTVWKGMSRATTEAEMSARRAAWAPILAASKGSPQVAANVYDALIETLDGTGVDAAMPDLLELCRRQVPSMVPATWRSIQNMKGLSAEDRAVMRGLLAHVSTPADLDRLWSLATTAVGGETLGDRAAVLGPLMSSTKDVGWTAGAVQTLRDQLGDQSLAPLGAATASLAAVLYNQKHPGALEGALDTAAWAAKLRIDGSDDPSVPELMTEVGAALLLNEDLEAARAHVARSLAQRRKDGAGAGRVEVGETEVVVGGIKIKRRAEPPSA